MRTTWSTTIAFLMLQLVVVKSFTRQRGASFLTIGAGAAFLAVVDTLARSVWPDQVLPAGVAWPKRRVGMYDWQQLPPLLLLHLVMEAEASYFRAPFQSWRRVKWANLRWPLRGIHGLPLLHL